ncbi:MAG: DUF192 domain-containing protein [bacterium]
MQDKSKFAIGIIITMLATAFILRGMNYYTKKGFVEIGGEDFKVEVVKKDWEMEKGLSGRTGLKDNAGMLFVFPNADFQIFWMKDMKFSIDIIWINEGKIVDIKERAVVPVTQYIESYRPSEIAKYVLEINAGLAEKYGFKIGDKVKLDI